MRKTGSSMIRFFLKEVRTPNWYSRRHRQIRLGSQYRHARNGRLKNCHGEKQQENETVHYRRPGAKFVASNGLMQFNLDIFQSFGGLKT